jgi:protein-glutamine gamma-glutamyltransferase
MATPLSSLLSKWRVSLRGRSPLSSALSDAMVADPVNADMRPGLSPSSNPFSSLGANQIEHSIALRVLVQTLVSIGITAMLVAASGVTDTTAWNWLAIPLSAAGGFWSWRSRRRANIAMKFIIAIGMLVSLGLFFGQLLSLPGDTRIVLAELLIQLQVLHSFDLPRRKDLGYSMMIGLILLGVAATISQTLSFAPLLFGFLLVALPVLMLDYRSRIGLLSAEWRAIYKSIAPKQYAAVLFITLLLGLAIFAALPRLPGYQLRAFPVSGSLDTETPLDNRTIFNPGYISGGNGDQTGEAGAGTGGSDSTQSPESGPGRMSTDFYYGFNQRVNQNLRGEMIPKMVMRVRSQIQGFWRVMAFDRYTGQGWEVSRNEATSPLYRSPISYQFLPPRIARDGPTQEVVQTYTMVDDFQNLIPALYEPKEVFFPAQSLSVDQEGSLRAPRPLAEGLTYTVVSSVPLRDPAFLRQTSTKYPTNINRYYLQVPEATKQRIRRETERLLATAPEPLTTVFDKAQFLTQTLKSQYQINEDLPFFEPDEDLVEAFLFKYKGGTADHFSTVLTIMLRSIGIPARLVAGFGAGEFNPFTGFYLVRNTDAYAITEVYFTRQGWFTFDPIPGHVLIPPSVEDADPFSILRQLWRALSNWLPAPVVASLQQVWQAMARTLVRIVTFISRFWGKGWLSVLWGAVAMTIVSFIGWLAWQGWRNWQRQRWLTQLHPMERLYQQLLARLQAQGYPKSPSQTPFEYLHSLGQHPNFQSLAIVQEITQAYVRWRYGAHLPNLDDLRSQLRQMGQRHPRRQDPTS